MSESSPPPVGVLRVGAMRRVPRRFITDELALLQALTLYLGEDSGYRCLADINGAFIDVPRAWPGLTKFLRRDSKYVIFADIPNDAVDFGSPIGSLGPNEHIRYDQGPAWSALSAPMRHPFGRVLVLGCGKGKTILALRLMALRSRKTLVVCHTLNLMYKWAEECRNLLPGGSYSIGFIGDGHLDLEADVVFATMQGLVARSYPQRFWDRWGLAIFDEGDLLGATQFSKIPPRLKAERVLVTATPVRSDGNDTLYTWHVGPRCYEDIEPDLAPVCYVLDSPTPEFYPLPVMRKKQPTGKVKLAPVVGVAWNRYIGRMGPNITKTISNCELVRERHEWTLNIVCDLITKHQRRVLFLGERVDGLKRLHADFVKRTGGAIPTGLALGKKHTSAAEIAETLKTSTVVWGIQNIAQRGLDERGLDTVVMQYASYKSSNRLQQTAGRVLRFAPGKKEPWVVLLNDARLPILHEKALGLAEELRMRWGYQVIWEEEA